MTTKRARAASNYRQVRLTYTEEASGRLSYRIYVKPMGQPWTERHCVVADSLKVGEPATSVEDVFHRLVLILQEQYLP